LNCGTSPDSESRAGRLLCRRPCGVTLRNQPPVLCTCRPGRRSLTKSAPSLSKSRARDAGAVTPTPATTKMRQKTGPAVGETSEAAKFSGNFRAAHARREALSLIRCAEPTPCLLRGAPPCDAGGRALSHGGHRIRRKGHTFVGEIPGFATVDEFVSGRIRPHRPGVIRPPINLCGEVLNQESTKPNESP
jgi:hypothetical protein